MRPETYMDFRALSVSGKGVITINVFEAVKQAVTTREAAEFYGIKVNRSGMAVCPFHDDKNPSMKVDKRFHCFGCGADGDVIDFVSRLFDLDKTKAALKLAADFGVSYEYNGRNTRNQAPVRAKSSISEELKYRQEEQHTFRVLADYFHLLQDWEIQYAPQSPDDEWHPLFVEALQRKTHVEYLLDNLIDCSKEEKKALVAGMRNDVAKLEQRIKGLSDNSRVAAKRLPGLDDIL